MWWQIAGAGAVVAVFALMIRALARASARGGQMEERAEQAEATTQATARAAESERKAHERMADVEAASVGEPADRIRERMRARDPKTK